MKRVKCTIEGATPLLCNRFTEEAAMQATSGQSGALSGDKGSPREQATKKLYTDNDGDPCIPQPNLFRCIIDAGKFFKAGKSKVTTQKSSLIPACVDIHGVSLKLHHSDPWEVDSRPVRIPSTGGRILTYRPCFNDWRLSFDMDVDDSMIAVQMMRDIVDAAGKRIGLGDFRPDCKGPFGKFRVTQWEVDDLSVAEAAE